MKMNLIAGEMNRIPKNGRNEINKYKYAMEADVVDFIRPLLREYKVTVVFTCQDKTTTTQIRHTKGGAEELIIITHLTMVVINAEDPDDTYQLTMPCAGADQGDKGAYKAITGGKKYLLMTAFNIASGEDPEDDRMSRDAGRAPRPKGASADDGRKQPPPESQQTSRRQTMIKRIHALVHELGEDDEYRHGISEQLFGKTSLTELSDDEIETLGKMLKQSLDAMKGS